MARITDPEFPSHAPHPSVPARMSDVAAAAGVSLVTVSRAINHPDQVAPETLAGVRAAVERLGYVPNLMAGSLASNRSRTIGAIVPTISNSVFSETVEALTQTLHDGGYQLLLGQTGYRPTDELRLVDTFLGRRVDGIVLTGVQHASGLRARLRRSGVPVVETWDMTDDPIDMAVGFSNVAAGRGAGDFLWDQGYRVPAFIGAQEQRAQQRLAGMRAAIAERGGSEVPSEMILPPAMIDDIGPRLASLLARQPEIDAIFCNNDLLAAGVLFECMRRSWAVPERLAVLGFGDGPIARACAPRLSTVEVRRRQIGERAGQLLLARLGGDKSEPPIVDIGFEIVRRESA